MYFAEIVVCQDIIVATIRIYTNALGSVPTQYFLLFKYLIPTLFYFFFRQEAGDSVLDVLDR